MIDQRKVREALRSVFQNVPGLPAAERRAWENRDFTPPRPTDKNALWVRETILPVSDVQVANAVEQLVAFAQYDVFCPKGRGTEAAEDLATAIGNAFNYGSALATSDIQISIVQAARQTGYEDGPWWGVPVRVKFYAYGSN